MYCPEYLVCNVLCIIELDNTSSRLNKYIYIIIPDNGINGLVDVTIAGCVDMTLPGYDDAPRGICKDVTKAYDLAEWGDYLNSTLTSQQGVCCTCYESNCISIEGRV